MTKVDFEAFFNHFEPFFLAPDLDLTAFLLAVLAWFGWSRPLNRTAFWLLVLTLAVTRWALVSRIYISGRPPVTNLYSSAVFIGWGCVLFGMVLEADLSAGHRQPDRRRGRLRHAVYRPLSGRPTATR